jgi:hypothetical protein
MGSRYEDTPNEARFQEITQRYGVSEVELQDFILAMIQEVKFLADCARLPSVAHLLDAAAKDITSKKKS